MKQPALKALKAFARNKYTFPGGYPCYAVMADCMPLSHKAVKDNYRLIYRATQSPGTDTQWELIGIDINWEDNDLYCEHTGDLIESAYGEDNE